VAGCGADAAPYFRIFNPIGQGQKFDADGIYTRRYVPELANIPDKYLFCPWEAPESVLKEAGVKLGKTYPMPMVDVSTSRNIALEAFSNLKLDVVG
jgi:deoxyribodipyrimidine photo-lyase